MTVKLPIRVIGLEKSLRGIAKTFSYLSQDNADRRRVTRFHKTSESFRFFGVSM